MDTQTSKGRGAVAGVRGVGVEKEAQERGLSIVFEPIALRHIAVLGLELLCIEAAVHVVDRLGHRGLLHGVQRVP